MIVAMFVMTKNPTMKTLREVAVSMKTRRPLFILFVFRASFGLYSVPDSSLVKLGDLVLVSLCEARSSKEAP